nr:hypothetical protein [Tanacetum cinerariifolium]
VKDNKEMDKIRTRTGQNQEQTVKDKQENDKIISKPDKNEKRGKAERSQK